MSTAPRARPVGRVTRGTTNPNRLRRVDRWVAATQGRVLRGPAAAPVVVDLGYGASPVTTLELHRRLARVRPDVRVVGLEIDPDRVSAAQPYADPPAVCFARGGFELATGGPAPVLVRALNVLRQYDEGDVPGAWATVLAACAPGAVLVEGTCDELGRLGAWVQVRAGSDGAGVAEPESLVLSWRLQGLQRPSVVAERLPKVLIHRNVPGEPVHRLLVELDRAWDRAAPLAPYGPRQRFVAAAGALREQGWPLLRGPRRWRLGELEVAWDAVAPGGSAQRR